MSEQRINKLEDQMQELQKIFYRVEASLENIEKNISQAMSVKESVITHTEKFKVTENRLKDLETENDKLKEKLVATNLKIAIATGGWAVVVFVIQFIISKY